jgi:hypothetical protein
MVDCLLGIGLEVPEDRRGFSRDGDDGWWRIGEKARVSANLFDGGGSGS